MLSPRTQKHTPHRQTFRLKDQPPEAYACALAYQLIPSLDNALGAAVGKGGFGQVLEVAKRDCGKHYAMKVMEKRKIADVFGEDWEEIVITERRLLAKLHHPLLINLAYAFQNVSYLILVMDLCYGGDLSAFGVDGLEKLTSSQVKFVGLEVTAVLLFLHSQCVMFRDLKPGNLLLDNTGHVRLIDFGIAEQGDLATMTAPTSLIECGSGPYVAPEVRKVHTTKVAYGAACDFFAFGTMLYEFTEKRYPFGPGKPLFEDVDGEFIQPELLGEDGKEVPGLYDLITAMLDWSVETLTR